MKIRYNALSLLKISLVLYPATAFAQEGLGALSDMFLNATRVVLLLGSGLAAFFLMLRIADKKESNLSRGSLKVLFLGSLFILALCFYSRLWVPSTYPSFKVGGDYTTNLDEGRFWLARSKAPFYDANEQKEALEVARKYFKAALAQNAGQLEPYLGIIESYSSEGDTKRTKDFIKTIAYHVPWSDEAFLLYVKTPPNEIKARNLNALYEFALTLQPADAQVLESFADYNFTLAALRQNWDRNDLAPFLEANQRMLEQLPNSIRARSNLLLFTKNPDPTALYGEIKKIEAQTSKKSESDYFYLGQAHLIMGDWAKAEKNLRQIKDPNYELLTRHYWLGAIKIANADISGAVDELAYIHTDREDYYLLPLRDAHFNPFLKWGLSRKDIEEAMRDNTRENEQPEVIYLKRAKLLVLLHRCLQAKPDLEHVLSNDSIWAWIREDAEKLIEQCQF